MTLSRQDLLVLWAGIALIHLMSFFGATWLLQSHGASMPALIAKMDQVEYMQLANTMLDHDRFALGPTAEPEIFRTPGYPALIALTSVLTGNRYESVFVTHAILLGLLSLLVALIGIELGLSRRNSLLAGTLIGISSGSILLSATGTGSDIVYTFLYALAAYIAIRLSNKNILHRAGLVGLVLGIATLTRPIGILASMPLLLGFAILHTRDWRSYMRATTFALALWVIVLTPWYARNAVVAGTPVLSTISLFNMTRYNIPMNEYFWRGTDEKVARDAFLMEQVGTTSVEALRGASFITAMQAADTEYLQKHGIEYGIFHLYRTIPFFFMSGFNVINAVLSHEASTLHMPLFPTENENLTRLVSQHQWSTALSALGRYWFTTLERIIWLLVSILALASPFLARGFQRKILILFVLLIITNIALISPVTQARYRFPAEPFMWTAAIVGCVLAREQVRKNRSL